MKKSTFFLAFSFLFLMSSANNSFGTEPLHKPVQKKSPLESHKTLNSALILNLKNGNYTEAGTKFSTELKIQIDASHLEQVWTMLIGKYGEFQSMGKSAQKITSERTTLLTTINFEKESFDLSTSLNAEGLISSLNIIPPSNKQLWEFPLYGQKRNAKYTSINIGQIDPLMGELLEPKKNKKASIVVFVHGSGPNDMDESLGPNKFFKDLAYGLANRGIASIRYNKRTYDYPSKMAKLLSEIKIDIEVTDDAVSAIQYAKTLGYSQVILAGHSLGGHMAPKIAALEKVDGVIILAGNSSPLVDLLIPQFEHLSKNDSTSGINEFQLKAIKAQVEKVKSGDYNKETHSMMLPLGLPGTYWKSLDGYDPVKLSSKQKSPYLILNGTRDYQVDVAQAKAWKNGNKNANSTTRIFNGLNHLFYGGKGICLPAEYDKKGHVDLRVIETICNWINEIN